MDNTQLLDAVNEVRQFADKTQENPLGDTRTVDSIEVNQWVRQGDIYLQRIPSRNPE